MITANRKQWPGWLHHVSQSPRFYCLRLTLCKGFFPPGSNNDCRQCLAIPPEPMAATVLCRLLFVFLLQEIFFALNPVVPEWVPLLLVWDLPLDSQVLHWRYGIWSIACSRRNNRVLRMLVSARLQGVCIRACCYWIVMLLISSVATSSIPVVKSSRK